MNHRDKIKGMFLPLCDKAEVQYIEGYHKTNAEGLTKEDRVNIDHALRGFNAESLRVTWLYPRYKMLCYSIDAAKYVALVLPQIFQEPNLIDALIDFGLDYVEVDYGHFLALVNSSGTISVDDAVTLSELYNVLGYDGSEFLAKSPEVSLHDVMSLYEQVIVFEIPVLLMFESSHLQVVLAQKFPSFRPHTELSYDPERLTSLSALPHASSPNIYRSLISSSYSQAFVDLFRCFESFYYVPWMLDLKAKLNLSQSSRSIKKVVKSSIDWNLKHGDSLAQMFQLAATNGVLSTLYLRDIKDELNINVNEQGELAGFQSRVKLSPDFPYPEQSVLAERLSTFIYALRNQNVHHEDYDRGEAIYELDDKQWSCVYNICLDLLEYFYLTYKAEVLLPA
ncbi:hypothetical protein ACUN9V_04980 [Salinicola sp. V024]|uniref:hypothetical protein n=1 Tax=Salinicola sp. V024 TaxID=3459609 RepID=UPI004044038B